MGLGFMEPMGRMNNKENEKYRRLFKTQAKMYI